MTESKDCASCRWLERGTIDVRALCQTDQIHTFACRQLGYEIGTLSRDVPIFMTHCRLWKRPARSTRQRNEEAVSLSVGGTD